MPLLFEINGFDKGAGMARCGEDPLKLASTGSMLEKRERCRNEAFGESSTFRLFVSMMWSAVALDAPAARLRGRMFPCASIPKNRRATT